MPDTEDQHDQLIIHDVIDDSVVTDSDAQLALAALKLDATGWARVISKGVECLENTSGGPRQGGALP